MTNKKQIKKHGITLLFIILMKNNSDTLKKIFTKFGNSNWISRILLLWNWSLIRVTIKAWKWNLLRQSLVYHYSKQTKIYDNKSHIPSITDIRLIHGLLAYVFAVHKKCYDTVVIFLSILAIYQRSSIALNWTACSYI